MMQASDTGDRLPHSPVLYQEILQALQPKQGRVYVDGTLGAGGHAWGILEASSPDGLLLGLDVDPQAIEIANERLSKFYGRYTIRQASYTTLVDQLASIGWNKVHGIVLDLGLSSMQLDTPGKGFSFSVDDPLDMRFDPGNPVRAEDLVNDLSEEDLARIIFEYGEERLSRQVARSIVQSRPVKSTRQLADIISRSIGNQYRGSHIHPATRTFQALRIEVNQELQAIKAVLPQAIRSLLPGGRLAVIAFHSLEDRLVKETFRMESRDCICPPKQPICTCGHKAVIREIIRRPIRPGEAELHENPRARSARLRIAEKLLPDPF
jgi:16S rRNA (cytosine1402-N4)-methyltransferase